MKNVITEAFLGIDVGSVTTKLVVIDNDANILSGQYLPTRGAPLSAIREGLRHLEDVAGNSLDIRAVTTTGSARDLAGAVVGADFVKNEITCQAVAAVQAVPEARTIIEIGGQDSKLILVRDGLVTDFDMNTVCAAGTGSFLDHQAARLSMTIEEFSQRAALAEDAVDISGKCTVFAESDMIHRQQTGADTNHIIYGLCRALVRNYLSDVASGKELLSPVVFQGGVAFNQGIVRALNEELGTDVIIPPRHEIMGAFGAALLAREYAGGTPGRSNFRGFAAAGADYSVSSVTCRACPENCEILRVSEGNRAVASCGGKCDKWHSNLKGQGVQ